MDEHFLVIIDNMVSSISFPLPTSPLQGRARKAVDARLRQMNLDILYEATDLTDDPRYARVANRQAEKSMDTHVRPNGTTYHVVNMDQKTGKPMEFMTHQGEYALLQHFFPYQHELF